MGCATVLNSKLMMPTLFILLLVIVVAACMLPNASKGIEFLFKPDWDMVNGDVFLGALGQSFYSMSIAMGCICTYASYFSKSTNLTGSAVWSVDFREAAPGRYRLVVEDVGCSMEFEISPEIYREPYRFSVRGYYYMRLGEPILENISPAPRQPRFADVAP